MDVSLIEQELEIEFNENLLAFQDTVPRYMKNKKIRRQRKKTKKDGEYLCICIYNVIFNNYYILLHIQKYAFPECVLNETLTNAKVKLWSACKLGDDELLSSVINDLLIEIEKSVELENKLENKEDVTVSCNSVINKDDVTKLVNDPNEDGNTMLHVAALGGHLKLVWYVDINVTIFLSNRIFIEFFGFRQLMEVGSDPCNKNKKLQTPYAAANDKETRNIFRRFMGSNPDKFNYSKVFTIIIFYFSKIILLK